MNGELALSDPLADLPAAVARGQVRRPPLAELEGFQYFVDERGHVYSMNSEEPRVVPAKTGWGGLDWVVLMTDDGWRRYCVGELIAETFLAGKRPGAREDYTIEYLDGNAQNNDVSNLSWITRIEASRRRQNGSKPRSGHTVKAEETARRIEAVATESAGQAEAPAATARKATGNETKEVLRLIEEARALQERLEEMTQENASLMEAVAPFAAFAESPEVRVGHPEQLILEAHRGRPTHRKVTVADFRRALEVVRALELKHESEQRSR